MAAGSFQNTGGTRVWGAHLVQVAHSGMQPRGLMEGALAKAKILGNLVTGRTIWADYDSWLTLTVLTQLLLLQLLLLLLLLSFFLLLFLLPFLFPLLPLIPLLLLLMMLQTPSWTQPFFAQTPHLVRRWQPASADPSLRNPRIFHSSRAPGLQRSSGGFVTSVSTRSQSQTRR